jgi:hypothetical protein
MDLLLRTTPSPWSGSLRHAVNGDLLNPARHDALHLGA